MIGHLDSLLASYDRGALSRRQLLGALAAVASPIAAAAQPAGRDSFFLRDPGGASVQVSAFDWKA